MFHNRVTFQFMIGVMIVLVIRVDAGWGQNETPADVPQQQPTATAVPAVPVVPAIPPQTEPDEAAPTPGPVRERAPAAAVDEEEAVPLYMNMAVYVGGFCFLVVFIGLYAIMSSTPKKSKRRRKK